MVQKDGRIILGYRRLEEWFYRDLKRMSQWIEEVTFVWLNLLYRSSKNWYRRMEEWFYRDLNRKSKWMEEVIFGWLKLLYRRMEECFCGKLKRMFKRTEVSFFPQKLKLSITLCYVWKCWNTYGLACECILRNEHQPRPSYSQKPL